MRSLTQAHWVFVVGYQSLKVYWGTEDQTEYTQNKLIRDFLALFLMKWGDQKHLSSVNMQANGAWEAQELQLHMWSEINDIIKITEP